MKKTIFSGIIFTCIICLFTVYSVSTQDALSKNLVRLHIIANSNTPQDQTVKLAVRDKILEYAKTSDKTDIEEFENIANNALKNIGMSYGAKATFENCYVPTKEYKSVTLPQGYYNCLKVVLGDGVGENWWCIAYPPLCYTESMFGDLSENGIEELSSLLDEETMQAIVKQGKVNFRFKIVDEIQKILHSFEK